MAAEVLPQVHGVRVRVTKLTDDGHPDPGAGKMYVTDAFTTLMLGKDIQKGNDINEQNAQGLTCVSYQGPPSFRWGTAELDLCSSDPYLEAILSRGQTLDMGEGVPAGFAYPEIGPLIGAPISIEVWAKRINDGDVDPDFPYAWWALPKVVDLEPAEREFSATAQKPKYVGRLLENPNWFDGPTNDWPAASDRVAQWVPTTTVPAVTLGHVGGTVLAS